MSKKVQSFEENMKRLEEIVRAMEIGDVPLDESMKLFQEGTKLVEKCARQLDDAELQIKKIVTDANGGPLEEEFQTEL